ncbi:recombinase family protein [Cellulosimicrobium cellulans]|uniref:recombinase family protein n=1 Tax=Cellulosimicrobium cellulans TaxID=1710 RepID=UPI0036E32710
MCATSSWRRPPGAAGTVSSSPGSSRSCTSGDTLVATKLDRLGLSAAHIARLVCDFDDRGVTLRSLTETLDTSSAAGRPMVRVLAAVA